MLSTFIFDTLNISTVPGTVVRHVDLHDAMETATLILISHVRESL